MSNTNDVAAAAGVAKVMSRKVLSVAPWTRVGDALDLAAEWSVRHLPVVEAEEPLGMICVCDLEDAPLDAALGPFMKRPIATIAAVSSIQEAACKMAIFGIGSLLVTFEGRVVGILTRGDLLRAGLSEAEALGDRRCSACGDYHHVHFESAGRPALCPECKLKSAPAHDGGELGVAD
jgi:CBS domain-containing protein